MSEYAIKVEGLGKKYLIKHQHAGRRYVTLRDLLGDKVKSMFGNREPGTAKTKSTEEFWALKDVSFEIKHGEAVGIVGRNGAGKSTLLKLLSRITEPTTGDIRLRGRVASLLEVGTGFHPELTGRENIFLNGAILGMKRAEIRAKFDEMVAFAEVEKFLDTPVKRYSSGMYMRLAFAVAAHLEPEILVVDEVLAVGDVQFQKKCLGKMGEVAKQGRTVLFVSHNLNAIRVLCSSGVLLDKGEIRTKGEVGKVLEAYATTVAVRPEVVFEADVSKPSITRVAIDQGELEKGNLAVDIEYQSPFPVQSVIPGLVVSSPLGTPLFGSNPRFHNQGYSTTAKNHGIVRMIAKDLPLFSGLYKMSVWLGDWHQDYDCRLDAISFDFKPCQRPLNLPNLEAVGHIDCQASWRLIE